MPALPGPGLVSLQQQVGGRACGAPSSGAVGSDRASGPQAASSRGLDGLGQFTSSAAVGRCGQKPKKSAFWLPFRDCWVGCCIPGRFCALSSVPLSCCHSHSLDEEHSLDAEFQLLFISPFALSCELLLPFGIISSITHLKQGKIIITRDQNEDPKSNIML